jgi:spore coat protein U-like protein
VVVGVMVAPFLLAERAQAATANATMAVSATVQASCSISANALSFGTYTSAQLDASTTLSVNCTNTTSYNIGLDVGGGSGATVASRKMANGSQLLNYTVYSDTNRATVWGSTVGSNVVYGTGSGAAQTINVYGRIPAGQLPTPGSYTDTLTATITY